MKLGISLIIFLGVLIFALKMLGVMIASPLVLFAVAFCLAVMIIMFALLMFAKSQKEKSA